MNELPRGWAEMRLDEVAEVRLGRQRSPKNHVGSRMRPYLRAANVTWGGLDLEDVKEMNFTEEESHIYELEPGDVLVAEASGSADEVGKPAIWRGAIVGCCFQNTLIRVRSNGSLPEYLRYFLLAEAQSGRIGRASPGVGIHHIGATRLSAWRVPLPPLAEQRRIVAAIEEQLSRLDAADLLLRSAAQRVLRMREAFRARAFDASWPAAALQDLLREPLRNGHSAKSAPDGTTRVITLTAVTRNEFSPTHAKLAQVDPRRARDLWLEPGDILIERSNTPELVGTAARYDGPREWAIFPDLLIRVRTNERVSSEFLVAFLQSPPARRHFRSRAQGIAGSMPKIDQNTVESLRVPTPSPAEQAIVVERIGVADAAVASLRISIRVASARSVALRRAILARAFRGELVPQDPDDEPASVLLARIAVERAQTAKPQRKRRERMPS